MAFCPHCGAPMPDDAHYCMSCSWRNTQLDSQGSSALRMFMIENNGLITALLVGMCVSLVFTFLTNLVVGGPLVALVGSAMPGCLVGAVFFLRSHGSKFGNIPTSGFTVIKVISIIQLVLISLASALMLLSGLILISAKDMADEALEIAFQEDPATREAVRELAEQLGLNSSAEIMGFLAAVMLVIGVFYAAYVFLLSIPMLRHACSMRDMVALSIPAKPAVLLSVMLWVAAGFNLFSLAMMPVDLFNLLSVLASVVTNACGALLVSKASKNLTY